MIAKGKTVFQVEIDADCELIDFSGFNCLEGVRVLLNLNSRVTRS
jgi:hypothetical protein